MKNNKFFKTVAVILCVISMLCCFTACNGGDDITKKNGDGSEFQQAFLPTFDRDSYFFGIGALASETMWEAEPGSTSEWIAKNDKALGVQTQRVWMHLPNIITRANNSNRLSIKRDMADVYHDYFKLLQENGVKRIIVMNHEFLYPHDYPKALSYDNQVAIHPIEEPEFYATWIEMYYDAYKLLATEFPEIKFWEVGNEYDMANNFFHRNDTAQSLINEQDKGWIIADLCYAANKGLKEVNRNNACIVPSFAMVTETYTVFNNVYTSIESKTLPTLEEHYLDDPDDYFDIVAWHPYEFGIVDRVKEVSLRMYDIMKEHGDAEKRVFFTELGISEAYPNRTVDEAGRQSIAEDLVKIAEMIEKDLPFVETVCFFRQSDRYVRSVSLAQENHFGLFFSPDDTDNYGKPKAAALALFKHFNGENADTSGLYWYSSQHGITQ